MVTVTVPLTIFWSGNSKVPFWLLANLFEGTVFRPLPNPKQT